MAIDELSSDDNVRLLYREYLGDATAPTADIVQQDARPSESELVGESSSPAGNQAGAFQADADGAVVVHDSDDELGAGARGGRGRAPQRIDDSESRSVSHIRVQPIEHGGCYAQAGWQ